MESLRDERSVRPVGGPAAAELVAWDEAFERAGANPAQRQRIWFQGLRGRGAAGPAAQRGAPFGRRLLAEVARFEAELEGLARPLQRTPSSDGAERLVLGLQDGRRVEAVALPSGSACLSSQVGCAVACRFCMTGQGGLERQLTALEILACWLRLATERPLKRALFMGMGEPAHNLTAVLEAIDLLGQEGQIGHKQLVFSTVGDPRAFEALATRRIKPALALSLHTTQHALRRQLLPRAPDLSPLALVEAASQYAELSGYPVQVQWTLLEGVNDGDDELEAVGDLLRGRRMMLNLIPFNDVEGSGFRRPSWERAAEMARRLNRQGVYTRLRRSAGQDVEGGCGQLRARRPQESPVTIHPR